MNFAKSFFQAKDERIASLETENAMLYLKLAQVHKLFLLIVLLFMLNTKITFYESPLWILYWIFILLCWQN